jgi:hypothetical protein
MQPQGQQMPGMEMQQGQQLQSMGMAPQMPSPEAQLNMQPVQPENQQIIQKPDAMQPPNMMQNGNMNMSQPQIYENPPEPKQETAAAPPPPPPNDPPINTPSSPNAAFDADPNVNINNSLNKFDIDLDKDASTRSDEELQRVIDRYQKEIDNRNNQGPMSMDMQSKVM